MFKKYTFQWGNEGCKHSVDFFVNSKKTKNGFMHRACVIGNLPRLDDMGENWIEYRDNEVKLFDKRAIKVRYMNRTWEVYSGQACLQKLWDQLDKLKFIDMAQIYLVCPFNNNVEPEHEELYEADELFARFSGR